DIVNSVSTAVHFGTIKVLSVAGTAGIVTLVACMDLRECIFSRHHHVVLYQYILGNMIAIEHIFPLQALVDDLLI
nr:hypothetical protein [Tanacetum cinerariifolium]